MSRVKITEYRAKKLLIGDTYPGIPLDVHTKSLPKSGVFVVKVDQGIKKRFVQGLVALSVSSNKIQSTIAPWKKKGYSRFLLEPMVPHSKDEELYLSFERVRDGVRVLFARAGGIDIESRPDALHTFIVKGETDIVSVARSAHIPVAFLSHVYAVFQTHHFAFLEINPLLVRNEQVFLLDAAVLVDSAAVPFIRNSWSEEDVVEASTLFKSEQNVRALARTTSASLSLKVLNPNGSIFFLLSGGGGSIVIADEAALKGASKLIGNYGEYSGGPTQEETRLYTREVLNLMLSSQAKKKCLVIAGGIANFTNIKTTFAGIIDALQERMQELQKQKIRIFIRRGGPAEKEGLAHIHAFLDAHGVTHAIYGSDDAITSAVSDAVRFVTK